MHISQFKVHIHVCLFILYERLDFNPSNADICIWNIDICIRNADISNQKQNWNICILNWDICFNRDICILKKISPFQLKYSYLYLK